MFTISVRRGVVVLRLCVGMDLQLTLSFPDSYFTNSPIHRHKYKSLRQSGGGMQHVLSP